MAKKPSVADKIEKIAEDVEILSGLLLGGTQPNKPYEAVRQAYNRAKDTFPELITFREVASASSLNIYETLRPGTEVALAQGTQARNAINGYLLQLRAYHYAIEFAKSSPAASDPGTPQYKAFATMAYKEFIAHPENMGNAALSSLVDDPIRDLRQLAQLAQAAVSGAPAKLAIQSVNKPRSTAADKVVELPKASERRPASDSVAVVSNKETAIVVPFKPDTKGRDNPSRPISPVAPSMTSKFFGAISNAAETVSGLTLGQYGQNAPNQPGQKPPLTESAHKVSKSEVAKATISDAHFSSLVTALAADLTHNASMANNFTAEEKQTYADLLRASLKAPKNKEAIIGIYNLSNDTTIEQIIGRPPAPFPALTAINRVEIMDRWTNYFEPTIFLSQTGKAQPKPGYDDAVKIAKQEFGEQQKQLTAALQKDVQKLKEVSIRVVDVALGLDKYIELSPQDRPPFKLTKQNKDEIKAENKKAFDAQIEKIAHDPKAVTKALADLGFNSCYAIQDNHPRILDRAKESYTDICHDRATTGEEKIKDFSKQWIAEIKDDKAFKHNPQLDTTFGRLVHKVTSTVRDLVNKVLGEESAISGLRKGPQRVSLSALKIIPQEQSPEREASSGINNARNTVNAEAADKSKGGRSDGTPIKTR